MIKVFFDVELAKKITNGEVEGRIVTRHDLSVRIICWDIKDEKFPLGALVCSNHKECFISYTIQGKYYSCKTVEHNYDLMLEIPEYMTFKDGDIATLGWSREDGRRFCEWITILKNIEVDKYNILTEDYVTVCLKCDTEDCFPIEFDCTSDGARWVRKPTEPEKQKLIEALKESKEPKAKECLKKLGIEQKPEYEFKPFDKVLVRNDTKDIWVAEIFSNYKYKDSEHAYTTLGGVSWKYCVPYNENTKYLLGTFKYWEETR